MYYDSGTRGFYPGAGTGRIEITDERYRELLAGQNQGGEIRPGPDGAPVLTRAPSAYEVWDQAGGAWVVDAAALVPALRARLAALRWARETGGVVVDGVEVATDRDSQALLTGAALSAQMAEKEGEAYEIGWKALSGWVTLTGARVLDLAREVRLHVQAAFDAEATVAAAVASGEITSYEALEARWRATV